MSEEVYQTDYYRLRASAPMPVRGSSGANFVLHTFGAEISPVNIYECTQELRTSSEFRGQGGDLVSAQFSRLGDKDLHFQGRETFAPDYVDETDFFGDRTSTANDTIDDAEFIECTSVNVSYDIMGLATVTYTIVSSDSVPDNVYEQLTLGGVLFTGYLTNRTSQRIQNTDWWETSVTLITIGE